MLIFQWLAEIGASSAVSIRQVQFFGFGETYYAMLQDGRRYQDNDLERMVAMVRDEFTVHNTTVTLTQGSPRPAYLLPSIDYIAAGRPSRADPLGQRGTVELRVYPLGANRAPTETEMALLDAIYGNVTNYNLTGEWTRYAKENL